jgi:hypothetical protein
VHLILHPPILAVELHRVLRRIRERHAVDIYTRPRDRAGSEQRKVIARFLLGAVLTLNQLGYVARSVARCESTSEATPLLFSDLAMHGIAEFNANDDARPFAMWGG